MRQSNNERSASQPAKDQGTYNAYILSKPPADWRTGDPANFHLEPSRTRGRSHSPSVKAAVYPRWWGDPTTATDARSRTHQIHEPKVPAQDLPAAGRRSVRPGVGLQRLHPLPEPQHALEGTYAKVLREFPGPMASQTHKQRTKPAKDYAGRRLANDRHKVLGRRSRRKQGTRRGLGNKQLKRTLPSSLQQVQSKIKDTIAYHKHMYRIKQQAEGQHTTQPLGRPYNESYPSEEPTAPPPERPERPYPSQQMEREEEMEHRSRGGMQGEMEQPPTVGRRNGSLLQVADQYLGSAIIDHFSRPQEPLSGPHERPYGNRHEDGHEDGQEGRYEARGGQPPPGREQEPSARFEYSPQRESVSQPPETNHASLNMRTSTKDDYPSRPDAETRYRPDDSPNAKTRPFYKSREEIPASRPVQPRTTTTSVGVPADYPYVPRVYGYCQSYVG